MTNKSAIRVFDTAADVARAAAELFIETAAESTAERGALHTCLAGGSTPRAAYEMLAGKMGSRVRWPLVRFYFGDERNVPPDHPDSNYGMARRALLSRVPISDGHVYRMPGEKDAASAAREYDTLLREKLAENGNRFDLLWLGLGNDAHTASLFPETEALSLQERWCVENRVAKLDTERITLTYPLLNASRRIMFLVVGAGKAEALKTILAGPRDVARYPAQGIHPEAGELIWLVDKAAASKLPPGVAR